VKKHEGERIIAVIKDLMAEEGAASVGRPARVEQAGDGRTLPPAAPGGKLSIDRDQLEAIYRELKNRLIDDLRTDPILLKLIAAQPELLIELDPQVVTIDGSSQKGRIAKLIANGFLDVAKRPGEIRNEAGKTGGDINGSNISTILSEFVSSGFLTREGDRYKRAPGLKVSQRALEAAV
jgi:hypothetical protein